jgi:hypothetical protein
MACDFLFEKKKKHDPSSFLLPIIYPRLLIKNLKIEEMLCWAGKMKLMEIGFWSRQGFFEGKITVGLSDMTAIF